MSLLSGVIVQQIAIREGITDPQRQNFYLLVGFLLGSNPVGLGVASALANREALETPPTPAPVFTSP